MTSREQPAYLTDDCNRVTVHIARELVAAPGLPGAVAISAMQEVSHAEFSDTINMMRWVSDQVLASSRVRRPPDTCWRIHAFVRMDDGPVQDHIWIR